MQATREALKQEFISLRNAQVSRPKEHSGTRARNIYFDHLNQSDALAEMQTDEELIAAIKRMKSQ